MYMYIYRFLYYMNVLTVSHNPAGSSVRVDIISRRGGYSSSVPDACHRGVFQHGRGLHQTRRGYLQRSTLTRGKQFFVRFLATNFTSQLF